MSVLSKVKSFKSAVSSGINSAWDTVRGKVDDLSDAIYGVMPSPIQNAADKVGQPVANAVNTVADKVDNNTPEWAQALVKAGLAPYAAWILASTASAPVTLPIGIGAYAGAGAGAGTAAAAAAKSGTAGATGLGAALGAGVAQGVGSGIGAGIGSLIPAAANYAGAIDYNQTMRDTNKETNQTNMAIANQNLGFQRETRYNAKHLFTLRH